MISGKTKLSLRLTTLSFFILFIFNACILSISSADEYKLGPGDTISISVYNEEDLNINNYKIPNNGKIIFPLIGEVNATGKTLPGLKNIIESMLKDGYLNKPQLVVSIDKYRPFFINGQVKSPGGYPYIEGLTVRKAIAIAGGLTDRASMDKISLVTEGKTKPAILRNAMDKTLNPGDILTIGESLF